MTPTNDIDYINGRPTPALLRLQQTQLEILREIAVFCSERGIEFFLTAGSALGATRHNGFIPWDDDVDIGMLRDDYERFASSFNAEGPPGLAFQNDGTDADYFLAFGKVRMLRTYVDEPINHGLGFAQGIFIDVFPYDHVPKSAFARRVQISALSLLNLIMLSGNPEAVSDVRSFQLLRAAASKVRPLFPIGLVKRARRWVTVWPLGPRSGMAASYEMLGMRHWRRTRVPLEAITPTKSGKFGDLSVPVPADPERFLRLLYGDYEELPPTGQRRPHHTGFVNFDSASPEVGRAPSDG